MSDEKKSVTIRIDEADLAEWIASQSSPVASIRMAIKICMLKFGKDMDLSDAILISQFGNGNTSLNSNTKNKPVAQPAQTQSQPQTSAQQTSAQQTSAQQQPAQAQAIQQQPVQQPQTQSQPQQLQQDVVDQNQQNFNPNMSASMASLL